MFEWLSVIWNSVIGWVIGFLSSIPPFVEQFNGVFWVLANYLIIVIAAVLVLFVIVYYALFNPKKTTAGRFIFRFVFSLIGVIGLVVIGIFLNPMHGHHWTEYPGDVFWWRPLARVIVYGYVAYAVSALVVLVVIRKWWPERLHTAQTRELLEERKRS